jgi:hypothetical protein
MRRLSSVLAAVLLAGCSGGVSQESYDQITVGMTQAKVEEILGAGEEQTSGGHGISAGGVMTGNPDKNPVKTYLWKDGNAKIIVEFKEGVVVSKRQSGL